MKTALMKSLTAWMLGLSVFIGATSGPVQPAAAGTLLVGDTIQIVVTAPFYNELSWNNYAGYLGYQPVGARGRVIVGPTVDAWTTWVRVDLTLPTTHVIGWVQVSQVTKVTTTSVAPTITTPPSNATVTAPALASFSVSVSGTAPLSYQWQRNGASIAGATSASYTTSATSTLDSGSTFRVVVTNSAGSITSSAATLMVNAGTMAPSITSSPSNATATAPATANFSVSATGTAPLSYQWQKNGVNLSGATGATYTTPATSTADSSSTFRVVVTNSAGSITSSAATLIVNAGALAPSVTSQPTSTTVTAPALASFSVIASGTAPLSYQWQKNGLSISGATSATYTTPATSTADSGSTFRVVVTNSAGSVTSAPALLTVNVTAASVALTYNGKLRDKVGQNNAARLADGQLDGTFTMTLGGGSGSRTVTKLELRNTPGGTWDTVPTSIYWTLGVGSGLDSPLLQSGSDAVNFAMPPGGSMTLFATDCCGGMFATGTAFTLMVTFSDGTSATAMTTVTTAVPNITSQPVNATVTAPASATFSVGASGTAPLTYQWQKNNVNISGATAASYTTPATTTADSGSAFRVVVSNNAGSETSSAATLTVNAAAVAPTITTQPVTATVTGPATATFSVSAAGTSPLTYQWQKNGLVISGATSSSYTTPATSTTDSGSTFRVVVTNSAGSVTSANATLTVNAAAVAPTITSQPSNATVTAPASATFSVSASGTSLSYQWKKNNTVVGTGATYTTPATSTTDSGSTFSVVVTNAAGTVTSANATLTVNAPAVAPAITSQPSSATVTAPASATFSVSASGTSLSYQWKKNGTVVGTAATYTTPATSTADSGSMFSVVVTNSAGSVTSANATLTVNVAGDTTPPSIPIGLSASANSCSQITISWGASTDTGGSGLKGYNLYRSGTFLRQILAPTTTTTETGLAAASVYSYAVSAVDNAGNQSAQSATASTNTPPCNLPPSANAGPDKWGTLSTAVSLSGASSFDPDGKISTYAWSFGDSTSGSGVSVSHAYGIAGIYTVTLTVTDNLGATASDTAIVTITSGHVNPTLVGFVPSVGTARDVVVDPVKGLAYVASGEFGLSIVDVKNPSLPVAIGGANPSFYATRVALSGNLAVTAGGNGLQVVDVSVPTVPKTIGTLSASIGGVALAGQYAYVLLGVPGNPTHTDLAVVDLRVPTMPAIVGRVTLAGGVRVRVVGTLAYVAAGGAGLQIVDVSNAAAPLIITTLTMPNGGAKDVAVANGYAYVAANTSLKVIQVTNPSSPVIVASLATVGSTNLAIVGTRLHVLDGGLFKIIDVTNPAAPSLLSATDSRGAQGLAASGTLAYLASPSVNVSTNQGGLYTVDASVPSAPVFLANVYGGFENTGVAISGSLAVVATSTYGMKVVDVTVATAPKTVGSLNGGFGGVAMNGQYAYILLGVPGNPGHTDLAVVDLHIPTAPTIVGRITVAGGSNLRVVGSLVYVAAAAAGLQIIDVSTPTSPRIITTLAMPTGAKGLTIANGFAYVVGNTGMQIVNITNPSSPVIVNSLSLTGGGFNPAVAGTRLYVLDAQQLKIFDLTNPGTPFLLSTTTSYSAQALDVTGTLVFLAKPSLNHSNDPTGGIYVVDVSIPAQPTLVRQIIVPGTTRTVVATPGFVYAGDSASILDVISVSP